MSGITVHCTCQLTFPSRRCRSGQSMSIAGECDVRFNPTPWQSRDSVSMSKPQELQMHEVAKHFELWAKDGTDTGKESVQLGARAIAKLLKCGFYLELPSDPGEDRDVTITKTELEEVRLGIGTRLPLQYYSDSFNPLVVPAEAPLVGDLVDEITDIYRDVVGALRLHEAGYVEDAAWHWAFDFRSHWGEHATGALRAMYWHLREQ